MDEDELEMDTPDIGVETKPEEHALETTETKPKKKNYLCKIIKDEEEAKEGFEAPWTIVFTITDDKKGDVLTAVKDEINRIRAQDENFVKEEATFKRWMQRNFDVPPETFDNKEKFEEVYGQMDHNVDALINTGVTVVEEKSNLNENVLEPSISSFVPE